MTLKRQLVLYVVLLNSVPAALGVYFLNARQYYWFALVELSLLVTIPLGVVIVRRALRPLEFIHSSQLHLQQGDFATRYCPIGIAEVDRLIGLFNNMLEQLHEEQLRLGEQRGFFDKLLQATPAGLIIFDFDGRISNANPAAEQMFGLGLRQLKGRATADVNAPLAKAIVNATLPCLLSLPTGQRYRVQQSRFYDRGFQREFLIVEELTAELRGAERHAYEKLIRMTSHEVKNTVGVTNSLLEGCKDYCQQLAASDREDFTKALSVVITRNTHLADFMNRLAMIVHLPAPDCQPTDLSVLLQSLQTMFAVELRNRNIDFRLHCEGTAVVNLDQHLVEQALINVMKNAVEAVDRDGAISIAVAGDNTRIQLTVRDSAGALTATDRAQLFQPFYTSKSRGQGVGLMLVREVLNQHGFDYVLECEPGQWTEFRIGMGRYSDH